MPPSSKAKDAALAVVSLAATALAVASALSVVDFSRKRQGVLDSALTALADLVYLLLLPLACAATTARLLASLCIVEPIGWSAARPPLATLGVLWFVEVTNALLHVDQPDVGWRFPAGSSGWVLRASLLCQLCTAWGFIQAMVMGVGFSSPSSSSSSSSSSHGRGHA